MTFVTAADNRYSVVLDEGTRGWRVIIRDPDGNSVAKRSCSDETEARTYASSVRQHIYWLSEPRFRGYYRLP
jgi:hypothetical protein